MVHSHEQRPKIGEVAGRAGVCVDTVRYYEQRGILPPPVRLPSGYRTYAPSSIDRIVLTRRLRAVDMSIEENAAALAAHDRGGTCSSEVWRLEAVRARIETQIANSARSAASPGRWCRWWRRRWKVRGQTSCCS